ncbi:hypothetical protein L6252_01430 [Candidatus Parcubacteria bacterium]|nr:hypothetical protein [Candidatus Parcubacteria bacterium]
MGTLIIVGAIIVFLLVGFFWLALIFRIKYAIPGRRFKKEFGIGPNEDYLLVLRATKLRLKDLKRNVVIKKSYLDISREKIEKLVIQSELSEKAKEIKLAQKEVWRAETEYVKAKEIASACYNIGEDAVKSIEDALNKPIPSPIPSVPDRTYLTPIYPLKRI